MHLPVAADDLVRRDTSTANNSIWIGLGVAAIVLLFVILLVSIQCRFLRFKYPNPRFIPTTSLKNKWRAWDPSAKYGRISNNRVSLNIHQYPNSLNLTPTPFAAPSSEVPISSVEVDRRTSVRSIMTLPPYRISPLPSEQLIAREGERAGIDTVIEFPETEDDVESRREEEMAALYAIRQARRRELEEREERRQQRREARERGDWPLLERLEAESRARASARADAGQLSAQATTSAANSTTNVAGAGLQTDSAFLIAELASIREQGARSRRVSSVSYADLGLARHDGSRIRADSVESDNRPLLDSAASMGGSRTGSRAASPSLRTLWTHSHGRNASNGSVMSIDTDGGRTPNQGVRTPRTSFTRATRSGSDPPLPILTPNSSEEDGVPSEEPPRYDDGHHAPHGDEEAPPYTSPILARGEGPMLPPASTEPAGEESAVTDRGRQRDRPPQLPQLRTLGSRSLLPAIEVLSATPVNSVPSTPVGS